MVDAHAHLGGGRHHHGHSFSACAQRVTFERERDRVDQQDGSGPRTAHGPGSHVEHGHAAEAYVTGCAFCRQKPMLHGKRGLFGRGGPTEKKE